MQRVELAKRLILDARKRFIVFSSVGIVLVAITSFAAFGYYDRVISNQKEIHNIYDTLNSQLFLIHEIASLGTKFDDNLSNKNQVELEQVFRQRLAELNIANENFTKALKNSDLQLGEGLEDEIHPDEVESRVLQFMSRAQELSDKKTDSIQKVRENIRYLSSSSHSGFSGMFSLIHDKIKTQNSSMLSHLKLLGFFLIGLCVLEMFMVWALVFRPLYKTLFDQHGKLIEAVKESQEANKSRSDFIANISHEIRTPMTGILGYADLLHNNRNATDQEWENAIKIINQNAKHLMGLIDEVLDISKLESDKMEFSRTRIDLVKLVNEITLLFNAQVKEKGIDIRLSNKGAIPYNIYTDEKRLRQILLNLIDNAIKFTDSGYVELKLSYNEVHQRIVFIVKDTGSGISKNNFRKVFLPFEQEDTSSSRKSGGTGLGLYLSKKLANALGGDIKILSSIPNMGTEFKVEISSGDVTGEPMIADVKAAHSEPTNFQVVKDMGSLEGKHILVVDDAKENARLFQFYLKSAGAKVDVAYGGHEALKMAGDRNYDLILLDIQMPKMDGYTVLKKLRDKEFKIPILALTAHAMAEEKEKALRSGFNDHIAKPVNASYLVNSVNQHLRS